MLAAGEHTVRLVERGPGARTFTRTVPHHRLFQGSPEGNPRRITSGDAGELTTGAHKQVLRFVRSAHPTEGMMRKKSEPAFLRYFLCLVSPAVLRRGPVPLADERHHSQSPGSSSSRRWQINENGAPKRKPTPATGLVRAPDAACRSMGTSGPNWVPITSRSTTPISGKVRQLHQPE